MPRVARAAAAAAALVALCVGPAAVQAACVDVRGNVVAWTLILKTPDGDNYLYTDATVTQGETWTSYTGLNDTSGNPLAATLQGVYADEVGVIMYNDEFPPDGPTSFKLAHAKGVLALQGDKGFWLVHSAPKFPEADEYKGIQHGQLKFAQDFLCLTLSSSQASSCACPVEDVAGHLLKADLAVYKAVLGTGQQASDFPNFSSFTTTSNAQTLSVGANTACSGKDILPLTIGEDTLVAISKGTQKKPGCDLYEDLIVPYLGAGLEVESWINGGGDISSHCPQDGLETINIASINVAEFSQSWGTNEDHSKWAVTIPPGEVHAVGSSSEERFQTQRRQLRSVHSNGKASTNAKASDLRVTCIADMNRQKGQLKRGGGAVCFTNRPHLWQAFRRLIDDVQPCPAS